MPRLDHQVVSGGSDVSQDEFGDVQFEEPRFCVRVVDRWPDLHQRAAHLGVAGSGVGIILWRFQGRTVERDPRVALHSPTLEPPKDDPNSGPGDANLRLTCCRLGRMTERITAKSASAGGSACEAKPRCLLDPVVRLGWRRCVADGTVHTVLQGPPTLDQALGYPLRSANASTWPSASREYAAASPQLRWVSGESSRAPAARARAWCSPGSSTTR